ncbi:MAG: hypothetical protein JSS53_01905 [Proteobacteria bacterium]|nr:hypothetical protein [Pseudomonadota bacterium]
MNTSRKAINSDENDFELGIVGKPPIDEQDVAKQNTTVCSNTIGIMRYAGVAMVLVGGVVGIASFLLFLCAILILNLVIGGPDRRAAKEFDIHDPYDITALSVAVLMVPSIITFFTGLFIHILCGAPKCGEKNLTDSNSPSEQTSLLPQQAP